MTKDSPKINRITKQTFLPEGSEV